MTSLLRQIVAGPRAKHEETGLDLCYVTSKIIATSGPSQTYPQRAYRNPLDRLVAFLDAKHGKDWAIWEFRAEGTGYPDDAVYGRIRHYPWPDHHPPPFRVVPMIMASMRNWLGGGELGGGGKGEGAQKGEEAQKREGERVQNGERIQKGDGEEVAAEGNGDNNKGDGKKEKDNNRVVVVHCKAGKGRSGTMACSFLISERGWTAEDALARFTERRMRPKFGAGVSIPSQLRWVSYVDRWTRGGKIYVDRPVEIVEVHVWGLRNGVKVGVEGFKDEGKKIEVVHTFTRGERIVVEGDAPGGGGVRDLVADMAKYGLAGEDEDGEVVEEGDYEGVKKGGDGEKKNGEGLERKESKKGSRTSGVMRKVSKRVSKISRSSSSTSLNKLGKEKKSKTIAVPVGDGTKEETAEPIGGMDGSVTSKSSSNSNLQNVWTYANPEEPGGQAVIFKPMKPIVLANSDVNITLERRNRAPASLGLTMVTAVAHVWFNIFFEGNGPEQGGKPDDSGVFEIEWDKLDGIKGSSQKGTRACDRLSVVWRVPGIGGDGTVDGEEVRASDGKVTTAAGVMIHEPGEDSPVPQMEPADWKGEEKDPVAQKRLGLRAETVDSASVSKASSVHGDAEGPEEDDRDSLAGVKISGPMGEDVLDVSPVKATGSSSASDEEVKTADGPVVSGPKEGGENLDMTAQKGFIIE